MSLTHYTRAATASCLLAALAAGCGGGANPTDALARANSTNIQRLANLYNAFHAENEFRGPADEAAFQGFVRAFNPAKLKRIGVDPAAVDALFVSERDNQPFKIRYGIPGSAMGSYDPVIFESTGVDDKREVGFLNMTQRQVDAAEYETLWSGKALPAAPQRER